MTALKIPSAGPGLPAGRGTRLALTALRGSRRFGGPVAAVAVGIALVLVLQGNGFASTLVLDMLIYAIAAMSLDFLGGYAGLISLGQAGFLGVGAYGVAIAEVHFFSPWAAVGIGLGATLALGLALGIVAVRVRGVSFVIITLAMGQVLWGLAFQWVGLSEGDNGIPLTILPSIGPFDLNDPLTLRMTVLAVFAAVALLLVTMVHSPFGLSLRGVRSNETRMAALGYRTGLHCYLAWVIAVFFTGVAGVLYIFVNQLISPATMAFNQDGLLVIMVVLGGLRSIWGPALGAVVIVLFQQELSIYLDRWQTVMGLTLIAVVLFSPGGLWGLVRAAGRRRDALIARLRGPPGEAGRAVTAGPARPAEPPALEADHLCRRFRGVTAVADVSLRVAAGARFGIIGPNGAGKTTLFNLLSGELRPTTGSVALFGRNITALRTYRRAALGLGRTFQITRIFSDLTVLENLTLALHGLSRSKLSLLRPVAQLPGQDDRGGRPRRQLRAGAAAGGARLRSVPRRGAGARGAARARAQAEGATARRAGGRALAGRAGEHPGAADVAAGRADPGHDRARHRRPARRRRLRRPCSTWARS